VGRLVAGRAEGVTQPWYIAKLSISRCQAGHADFDPGRVLIGLARGVAPRSNGVSAETARGHAVFAVNNRQRPRRGGGNTAPGDLAQHARWPGTHARSCHPRILVRRNCDIHTYGDEPDGGGCYTPGVPRAHCLHRLPCDTFGGTRILPLEEVPARLRNQRGRRPATLRPPAVEARGPPCPSGPHEYVLLKHRPQPGASPPDQWTTARRRPSSAPVGQRRWFARPPHAQLLAAGRRGPMVGTLMAR
jgi:hypothetical protein